MRRGRVTGVSMGPVALLIWAFVYPMWLFTKWTFVGMAYLFAIWPFRITAWCVREIKHRRALKQPAPDWSDHGQV